MNFQVITPPKDSDEVLRARRKARERIDLTARDSRVSWEEVRKISRELVGKCEGLSLGECKKVIEEIKRRGR